MCILCIAFIHIACSSNTSDRDYLTSEEIKFKEVLSIEIVDTINISIPDSIPSELYFFRIFNGNIYALSFLNPYSIYTIDMNERKVKEFFKLDPKHQHFKINQYFINNSIISVISEGGEIMEFSLNSDSYQYFRIEGDEYPSDHGFVTPFLRNPPNLHLINNSYYFNVYPLGYFDDYSVDEKIYSPLFAKLNRRSKNLTFELKPSGVMANISDKSYPYDLSFPYLTNVEDTFYISYPMSHEIFRYDTSFQLIDQFQIAPKMETTLPAPMLFKDFNNDKYNMEYRMKSPYYSKINYYPDLQLMSRAFYSENSISVEKGKYNITCGNIKIIFLKKTGTLLKEFEIEREDDLLAIENDSKHLLILKQKNENELQVFKYSIQFIDN